MLYHLGLYLQNTVTFFNVFHYVSFRVMASLLTALILAFIFGNWFIAQAYRFKSKVREYTPQSHQAKNDTPTMGGIFILAVALTSMLLWCNLTKPEVWLFVICLLGFGAIGFWDDWSKIKYRKGVSEKVKLRAQLAVALTTSVLWYFLMQPDTALCIPFFKNINPHLGVLLIPWAVFILVGTSNAVNLTDGLDGLAIGSLIVTFGTFSIICYIAGHAAFAHYLHIPFAGTAEVAIIGAALVGSSLGFLWYNAYPAQIFMGDVGSLALGSALALMALMARQELLLAIAGGVFVAETLSVMAQVLSYKILKRRLFKMAPMHHHFELLGWPEARITTRFGIITVVLCLIALMTLKLR
ncbi:phospho-N-acetylmuramoyl-pentapeptide-transferase [Candidatus Dependentiae bacterium]|nr:phospho-N-acetylmuramoyl-pentapeptide-transferase [Candidatus Dependentiae bacterium]